MNPELFHRILEAEAENLFLRCSTPESFMNKVKPLIRVLKSDSHFETMSENDLTDILSSPIPKKDNKSANKNRFFDIVDLSLYRAN